MQTMDRSMVKRNKSEMDVVKQYFHVTDSLLNEIKQQNMTMSPKSGGAIQLKSVIEELSHPTALADKIRVAYIELSENIESEVLRLHTQGYFPDPYCGTGYKFQLMENISEMYRDILFSLGNNVPSVTLVGTSHVWRDKGILDFMMDQQNHLCSVKFQHMWDAVQCYEMQRYLISQLFEYLNATDNL